MRTLRRIDLASLKMMFAIALAAMVVRAMVPSGWMIMADPETGQPRIQLCSGKMLVEAPTAAVPATARQAHVDHSAHHGADKHGGADVNTNAMMTDGPQMPAGGHDEHDHGIAEVPCPFALSSLVGLAGDVFLTLEPHIPAAPDRAVPPVRGPPAVRIVHAPLPSRGPPSLV